MSTVAPSDAPPGILVVRQLAGHMHGDHGVRPRLTERATARGLAGRGFFFVGAAQVRYNHSLFSCRAATTEGSPPDARTAVRRLPARRRRRPRPRPDHPRRRRGPPREGRTARVPRYRLRTAGRLRSDRHPGIDPGRRGEGARPGGDARPVRRDRGERARRRRGHAPRRGRARGALPREREPVPAPGDRLRPRFHPSQARDLPCGRLRSRGRRGDREGGGPRGRGGDGPAVPGDRAPRLPRGGRGLAARRAGSEARGGFQDVPAGAAPRGDPRRQLRRPRGAHLRRNRPRPGSRDALLSRQPREGVRLRPRTPGRRRPGDRRRAR